MCRGFVSGFAMGSRCDTWGAAITGPPRGGRSLEGVFPCAHAQVQARARCRPPFREKVVTVPWGEGNVGTHITHNEMMPRLTSGRPAATVRGRRKLGKAAPIHRPGVGYQGGSCIVCQRNCNEGETHPGDLCPRETISSRKNIPLRADRGRTVGRVTITAGSS